MSLPSEYTNPEDYFQEIVTFFGKYRYLYNFANTDILVQNIPDKIHVNKSENIDVFNEHFDLPSNCEGNEFLENFFDDLGKFEVKYESFKGDIEDVIDVPLSPKKAHEIVYLAKEIAEMCERSSCDIVVDFGSGLGYLDQRLFQTSKLKVLGIECNENHYVNAKKRQRKYHGDSLGDVKYIKHLIGEESDRNIMGYLDDKFGNTRGFCIAGLHACADLTIDAIHLFLKMADAKSLVLMPCCYHKMKIIDTEEQKFKNFPLSHCLKEVFERNNAIEYLRTPFLRLAAQPPKTNESLENLVFNLLARAVIQLYAFKRNCKLKRNKRKAVKIKTLKNDFSNYIKEALEGFTLIENEPSGTSVKDESGLALNLEEVNSIWREMSHLIFKRVAIFILLQNYLQPVIENFVLYDRLVYLQEKGIKNCSYKKIFNEIISPRCLALAAYK